MFPVERILGLDVGSKTIGVAVSDPMGWTAQGVETIIRENVIADFKRIGDLIRQYEVKRIVVGLPLNMDGTEGERARSMHQFVEEMNRQIGAMPVILWDERLSTVAAERSLLEADLSREKRKKVINKMAAVFILQGYLDSHSTCSS